MSDYIGPKLQIYDVALMIVPETRSFTVLGARKTRGCFNIFLLNDFVYFIDSLGDVSDYIGPKQIYE